MERLYPNEIEFHNDNPPYLDEQNLNSMSHAIAGIDQRVIDTMGDVVQTGVFARRYAEEALQIRSENQAMAAQVYAARSSAEQAMHRAEASDSHAYSYMTQARAAATEAQSAAENAAENAATEAAAKAATKAAEDVRVELDDIKSGAELAAENAAASEADAAESARLARETAENIGAVIHPKGSVLFENLPAVETMAVGDMYNILDDFTTTDDFIIGAGKFYVLGTNVYKTQGGLLDVFAGAPVTGIKGNAEEEYRQGNVNITAENIGALKSNNPSATGYFEMNVNPNIPSSNGNYSFAEGYYSRATGEAAHSEGKLSISGGEGSHSEGIETGGFGIAAHAEGYKSEARANYTHAQNEGTIATVNHQTVIGKYNKIEDAALIVGNGTSDGNRSNAMVLDFSGNMVLAGDITFNDTDGTATTLSDLKKSVSDGKSSIASAITAKGVTTATDATFDTMATNIGKIQTGTPATELTIDSGYGVRKTLALGETYKIAGKTGTAIGSYNTTRPSESGAPLYAGEWHFVMNSGFAYSAKPKYASGTFQYSSTAQTKITLGFKPKYLAIASPEYTYVMYYDESVSTTQFMLAATDTATIKQNIGNTSNNRLCTVDSDGFTMNKGSSGMISGNIQMHYFAIG